MAGKSVENQLSNIRPIIIAMMERDGRNFQQCELCGDPIEDNRYEIHHTKYDGATYYDLRIVCSKCNHAPENVLLA